MSLVHTFAGNPLDRADAERRDAAWLAAAVAADNSQFLLFAKLNVLLNGGMQPELGWLSTETIARLGIEVPPVLLGIGSGIAHFAIDVSALEDPEHALGLNDDWRFQDCRMAAMALSDTEAGIVAQARSQLGWHQRHQFCGVCGTRTEQLRGGHVRKCAACGAEHFPRTDPVAIMLISDGDDCLLGQPKGPLVRTGMYSALAGFIDQGESIEEAVRREVKEEAGIDVGAVRYHSSQPWPFPSSLMIGCHGLATSRDITIDTAEMADVRWCSRQSVLQALAHDNPDLKVPGPIAIAHHLIKAWATGEVD
ncbi:MAG: NAD(+) diphosphatase [Gammaproteobacteria bacterium]|nr:NAD(+) diphosphatase [Gammaproteobacteria bacterium]